MNIRHHLLYSLSWATGLRSSTRILTIVKSAILARFFLTPLAFGQFGIVAIALTFLELLTETGINVFLIQKKADIAEYLHSAWVVSIFRGLFIAIVLYFSSPFIAQFFDDTHLTDLFTLAASIPVIRGFINPAIVKFQKELQFKREFIFRITLFVFDFFITVYAAFITKSAVSFILGQIASTLLEVILSFIFITPRPKWFIESTKVREIISQGKWVTLSGFFTYTSQEADDFAVGKLMGGSVLGLYRMAYTFSTMPVNEINEVVNKVVFPLFSKIVQAQKSILSLFIRVSGGTIFLSCMMSGALYIFCDTFVPVILGKNWLSIIPMIKVLVLYGFIRSVIGIVTPLFWALEKQHYVAFFSIIRTTVLVISLLIFIPLYQMNGIYLAVVLSAVAEIPFAVYYLYRTLYRYEKNAKAEK